MQYLKYSILPLVLMLILTSFNVIKPDSRLIDYLGQEKVNKLQKLNPDIIRYYNFFLDNSYIASSVPNDKLSDNNFQELVLPLKNGKLDKQKFNILKLNLERKYNESLYFKIKGSNEILMVLSEKEFVKKYNTYRKSLGLIKE